MFMPIGKQPLQLEHLKYKKEWTFGLNNDNLD